MAKKVDTTILSDGCTLIPRWVMKVWDIEALFLANSKKHSNALVKVTFKGKTHDDCVPFSKTQEKGVLHRLFINKALMEEMKMTFAMCYTRFIESGLRKGKGYKISIYKDIPF